MYETLSTRMDKVIRLAHEVAREYDQEYVGTEHLLLAILREGTGRAVAILAARDVSPDGVKAVVDRLVRQSMEDTWVLGRLPGTPHFRNVIASAIEEARQWESKEVCTEHVLLALLKEEGSVAYETLRELGIRSGIVRAAINESMN
jgi:ATP-dependent Clp protease ATP-binding subunit ClpC